MGGNEVRVKREIGQQEEAQVSGYKGVEKAS